MIKKEFKWLSIILLSLRCEGFAINGKYCTHMDFPIAPLVVSIERMLSFTMTPYNISLINQYFEETTCVLIIV